MEVKINELAETNVAQSTDVIPVVQNNETKKIQKQNFLKELSDRIENAETQIEENTIELQNRTIKTKTITKNLNVYGNVSLDLNSASSIVLGAKTNTNNIFIVPFVLENGDWAGYTTTVQNNASSMQLVLTGSIEITVYYIDIS